MLNASLLSVTGKLSGNLLNSKVAGNLLVCAVSFGFLTCPMKLNSSDVRADSFWIEPFSICWEECSCTAEAGWTKPERGKNTVFG